MSDGKHLELWVQADVDLSGPDCPTPNKLDDLADTMRTLALASVPLTEWSDWQRDTHGCAHVRWSHGRYLKEDVIDIGEMFERQLIVPLPEFAASHSCGMFTRDINADPKQSGMDRSCPPGLCITIPANRERTWIQLITREIKNAADPVKRFRP